MHTYIIGATRSGKSNHMLSMPDGRSFAFIDKHGEAARQLGDAYPCIYWEPARTSYVISLNPLQDVHRDERWKKTADLVSIFSDIWKLGPETPRLLYYLRASLRILLDTQGTSLIDIRRTLADDAYRRRLLSRCTDAETKQTWLEYEAKKEQQQAQEIASLQNKVAALAAPDPLRFILGQPTSTINIARVMKSGVPLIVDLSGMGDEPAALLGAIIINEIKQAAETVRVPFDLYIDEFQNFGTTIISTILSESGKFGLNLVLAHQFLSQLDPEIQDAVLGNCSTIVSFRIGPDDAQKVAAAIDIGPQALMDLGRGRAYFRTLGTYGPTSALYLETEKTELPTGYLQSSITNTQKKYSRPRKLAEALMNTRRSRRKPLW